MIGGKSQKGFTIIEVMLFLAISGFLFVGIAAGAGANIARQRYQTSVQDLTEFLRAQYSAVANTQVSLRATTNEEKIFCANTVMDLVDQANWQWKGGSTGIDGTALKEKDQARGRTDCLIYGKVVIFDDTLAQVASYDLLGGDYQSLDDAKKVSIESSDDPTLEALKAVHASPFVSQVFQQCSLNYNSTSVHRIQWDSHVELPYTDDIAQKTIIIVRSPVDGAMHTYSHDGVIGAKQIAGKNLLYSDGNGETSCEGASRLSYLASNPSLIKSIFIMENKFKKETVEFCVGSDDIFAYGSTRRMIRVVKDGHNSSAVELMNMDSVRPNDDEYEVKRGQSWCD